MNTIALTPTSEKPYNLDIEVDGRPLSHHFSDRHGDHPSQISPLGWSGAPSDLTAESLAELLGDKPSELESGRVAVLVCEECGDIACGAYCVRVVHEPERVRWTDWAFEDGFDPAGEVGWPTKPGDFCFDRQEYEDVLLRALPFGLRGARERAMKSRPMPPYWSEYEPFWVQILDYTLCWESKGSWIAHVLIALAMAGIGSVLLFGLYVEPATTSGFWRGFVAWFYFTIFFSKSVNLFTCSGPIAAGVVGFPWILVVETFLD